MDTRIQFRVELDLKNMAVKALERKGISLSSALRDFIKKLASTEMNMKDEDAWLRDQIEDTYKSIDNGEYTYHSEEESEEMINAFTESLTEPQKITSIL